jgi:hypothetical protein
MWVLFGSHFMFSNFIPVRFTQQNMCCNSKSTMKHMQNWVGNQTSPNLVMVIGNAGLLILLIGYIGPPNCDHC